MPKNEPLADAATQAAPQTKSIKLLKPHEHAGREYPPGAELTLPIADADWLVALKSAEPIGQ